MANTDIGDALAALRRVHGRISQRDLSIKAGFDRAYVGKVESGVIVEPSRDALEKVASALGATSAELEQLLRVAGHLRRGERLVPEGRVPMDVYLRGDPDLTSDQRAILLSTYQTFVRLNRGN